VDFTSASHVRLSQGLCQPNLATLAAHPRENDAMTLSSDEEPSIPLEDTTNASISRLERAWLL
jgi:hypothetical protein